MALGVAFGLVTSLVLKHSHLNLFPGIESCIVTLVAFTSYFMSTGMHMSGVVSLLFCGITLKHYAYHSMSRRTQRTTKYMFSILAQLSENFIFIYLGLNLFAQEIQVFKPLFILVTFVRASFLPSSMKTSVDLRPLPPRRSGLGHGRSIRRRLPAFGDH